MAKIARQEVIKGNVLKALEIYTEALALGSYNKKCTTNMLYNRAIALVFLRKYDDASQDCSQIIRNTDNNDQMSALLLRAYCYMASAKYDLAVADFKTLISLNHKDSERYVTRSIMISNIFKDINRYEKSFEILGLTKNATLDDITKAHRRLFLSCHPDKTSGLSEALRAEKQELFKTMSNAVEMLKDERNRVKYAQNLTAFNEMKPAFLDLLRKKFNVV